MGSLPFDREEGLTQHAVLDHILIEYPIHLTVSELVSELATDPDDFGQRDAVERAIQELTRVRLLYRHGPFVLPSRAALYVSQLWNEYV